MLFSIAGQKSCFPMLLIRMVMTQLTLTSDPSADSNPKSCLIKLSLFYNIHIKGAALLIMVHFYYTSTYQIILHIEMRFLMLYSAWPHVYMSL